MRMVAGGGSAGPISLLTSNIPPPMVGFFLFFILTLAFNGLFLCI